MDYMFGTQECSSGCESGWTLYLQHSTVSPDHASYDRELDSPKRSNDEDEDEDMSMVSDASSGPPPHVHEEEEEGYEKNGCGFYPYAIEQPLPRNINSLTRKTKKRENRCRTKAQQHSSLLDDTASSPFLNLCNKTRSQESVENVVEYSQGYSTTQFEERESAPYGEGLYDFFQPGNQLQQQNHRWYEGKRW